MKLHYIFTAILVGFFGITPALYGQEWQAGLDFQIGAPQGEFNTQLDRLGVGIAVSGGHHFKDSPFFLGLEFGFMNFGVDSREEPLSTTIPDAKVLVENSYNLATGDLLVRLFAPETRIRPYLDAVVGFNYFYTETTIKERGQGSSGEPILRDTNFDDFTLNYGIGAGLHIKVYGRSAARPHDEDASLGSIYVNLSGRYMPGREAEYLKEGSITRENGEVSFDVSRSKTDLLYFKLGIVFGF